MASSQLNHQVQRMYGEVKLDELDTAAQLKMYDLTRKVTEFGGEIASFAHRAHIASLGEGVAKELIEGTARDGLVMERICQGRTSSGHIGERFLIEKLQDTAEIGVRALLPLYGFSAIHEHITSIPMRPGKDMHGFAVDQIPHMARVGHVLLSSVGSDDRTLLTQANWVTTGTEDDHGSPRANRSRIDRWEDELGGSLAGSMGEHLTRMFEAQRRARRAVVTAVARGNGAFAKLGIDPKRFLDRCFPRCVIVDKLASGPPIRTGWSSAEICYPGDHDELVEAIEKAGRYGIARCKIQERVKVDEIERSLLPELSVRFGEEGQPVPVSILEEVADWKTAEDLGIGVSIRVVRYWYFKQSGHLLRAVQVSGGDGRQLYDVHLWRTIRLDISLLRETIALVERGQQPWPGSCVDRYRNECEPARMSPWTARKREGLLKVTLMPNGAGVTAHREMEVRHAAEDSKRAPVRRIRD